MSVPLPVSITLHVYPLSVPPVHTTCLFFCLSPLCPSVWPLVCLSPSISLCQFFFAFCHPAFCTCPTICPMCSCLSLCQFLFKKHNSCHFRSTSLSICLFLVSLYLLSTCMSLCLLTVCPSACHILLFCPSKSICSMIPSAYPLYLYAVSALSSCLPFLLSLRLSYCLYTCHSLYLSWASRNINNLTPRISLRWKGRKWFYYCCKL